MNNTGMKITIQTGTQAGESHWLTRRLTRIGSASGCDILLNGAQIPSHAASLERTEDGVLVHNRSESAIYLDGASLPPGGSSAWESGSKLRIGQKLELLLDCSATLPIVEVDKEEEQVAASESRLRDASNLPAQGLATSTPGSAASSNLVPLLFIAGCLGLIGYLIYFKLSGGAQGLAASDLKWEEVWQLNLVKQEMSDEGVHLRGRLQLLYRRQGLGETSQFEQAKGEALRSIDRASKLVNKEHSQASQLVRLKNFVNQLSPGAS